MFKKYLFLLAIIIVSSSFVQKSKPKGSPYLPDYFVLIPAGKVWLPDYQTGKSLIDSCVAFYISNHEVSNREYREFVFWMKQYKPEYWKEMMPDTTVWQNPLAYHEPFTNYYFQHPAYLDYPVVGVNKVQAEAYCSWLTEIYIPKKHGVKPVFRLPSRKEWIRAARGDKDQPYPHAGPYLRNGKGQFLCNFKYIGDEQIYYDTTSSHYRIASSVSISLNGGNYLITAPCISYWPNDNGLYNMSGNVAEIVEDENFALGGSWNDAGFDLRIDRKKPAIEPSASIGFRIVALLPKKTESRK